jgi:hypothetical protein
MDHVVPRLSSPEFKTIARKAEQEPVIVQTDDDRTFVVLSEQAYARLVRQASARLLDNLDTVHAHVKASGLSEAEIDALICDAR